MRAFPLPRAHCSVPASAYALCRRLAPAPLTHVTKQPSAKRERLTPAAGRAANAHASTPNVASDDASDAATVAPKLTGRGAGKRSDRGRGATLEGNEVDLASDGESEFSEPEFPMQVLPQRASLCHISAVAAPHRCVGPHVLSLNVPDAMFNVPDVMFIFTIFFPASEVELCLGAEDAIGSDGRDAACTRSGRALRRGSRASPDSPGLAHAIPDLFLPMKIPAVARPRLFVHSSWGVSPFCALRSRSRCGRQVAVAFQSGRRSL